MVLGQLYGKDRLCHIPILQVEQTAVPVEIRVMAPGIDGDHQIAEILVQKLQHLSPGACRTGQIDLIIPLVIPA